jgi:hypothetical protein
MACFPGLAAADENSGIQYEVGEAPTAPTGGGSNIPSQKKSGGSNSGGPNAEASTGPNGEGSGGGANTGAGSGPGQGNQGSGGNNGQGAGGTKAAGSVGDAQTLKTAPSAAAQTADDGSSPLVPILIAVAVLAAISIGAYYYRQRRQDPGSTVSPKAS